MASNQQNTRGLRIFFSNIFVKKIIQSKDKIWFIICKSRMTLLWRRDFLDSSQYDSTTFFYSNRKMPIFEKGPWFFIKYVVHGPLEKDLQKIVSLVKEKLVVVIDRVRYLPLCPEPKGQFTPIIFFLTNPGTPRKKRPKTVTKILKPASKKGKTFNCSLV